MTVCQDTDLRVLGFQSVRLYWAYHGGFSKRVQCSPLKFVENANPPDSPSLSWYNKRQWYTSQFSYKTEAALCFN